MSASGVAAKYGPTVLSLPFAAAVPFDPWWILFVPIGLMLGWMARAGRMIGERKPWTDIRRDMLVSVLIGGAQGLLAALLIWWLHLAYLPGLAVAFLCAFGGLQSIDTAVRWGLRHLVNDAEIEGRRRQKAAIMAAENREADLNRLAENLDAAITREKARRTMKLIELQAWLNHHGADIDVDGKPGPATRAAIIETFRNTAARAIAPGDIVTLSARLDCQPRQIRAFARVESDGSGWDDKGLLKCLWERHHLWKRIKFAIPFLSNPKPGGYTMDADHDGICDSWEKLADSALRFADTAFECASFGKFQVMGANWKSLGYPSVLDMVWGLSRDELAHYELFARFIEVNGLKPALRRLDGNPMNCLDLARGYNGKGQQGYDQKLARAYREDRP